MATAGGQRGGGPERAHAPDLASGPAVRLSPEESRHLVRVRRARAGDVVVLFDGRGGSAVGTLVEADPRAACVRVEGPYPDREPRREVTLAVALPEPPRADLLVGVLAEMGVARLVPLLTARTHPRRAAMAVERAPRWHRLAVEAAKVNGRARLLEIAEPLPYARALAAPAVLLDPDPGAPLLPGLLPATGALPRLLVGPEGGFTPGELDEARAAGVPRARLGAAVLRVENAALAAAAIALAVAG